MLAVGCRHFDWLDNLREHIAVDEIIRVQVMSERDGGEGDLEVGQRHGGVQEGVVMCVHKDGPSRWLATWETL